MKTFEEYIEAKTQGRIVNNFSEMMELIKSDCISITDRFYITDCVYLSAYNHLRIISHFENDRIFRRLAIDQVNVALHLYKDTARINGSLYPESPIKEDYLKLMAYCYAIYEELIIKDPLEHSIEQFNALYDEYLKKYPLPLKDIYKLINNFLLTRQGNTKLKNI